MRAVVQRVKEAKVEVAGELVSRIGVGFLVLLGVGAGDDSTDADYMVRKIATLRIFHDRDGRMRRSLAEVDGAAVLVVPQFTLYGDVRKGTRPSFSNAAAPDLGRRLYEEVLAGLRELEIPTRGGSFREMMQVTLLNDGPVTILLDSKKRF